MSGKVSSSFQGEANFFHRKDWILGTFPDPLRLVPRVPKPIWTRAWSTCCHLVALPSQQGSSKPLHGNIDDGYWRQVKGVVWSLYNKSPKFLQDIQLGQGHVEWKDSIDTLRWVRLNTNPNIPGFETQNKYYVYFPTPPTALPKGSKKAIG